MFTKARWPYSIALLVVGIMALGSVGCDLDDLYGGSSSGSGARSAGTTGTPSAFYWNGHWYYSDGHGRTTRLGPRLGGSPGLRRP